MSFAVWKVRLGLVLILGQGLVTLSKVATVEELVVSVGGNDTGGTDDDVEVTLSSIVAELEEVDSCTTPVLDSWANDWSRGDVETWRGDYLGECDGFAISDDSLYLTLSKEGNDDLYVESVEVRATYEGRSEDEEAAVYLCGPFDLRWETGDWKRKHCYLIQ